MNLSMARPFGFERVFAANDVQPRGLPQDYRGQLAAARTALARLQAEQAQALGTARADGFEAGLTQSRGEIASALLAVSSRVADTVGELGMRFAETETRLSRAAGELGLAAAEILAARAIAGNPLAAIDDAIGRLLSQVGTREELRVYVHPSLSVALRAIIAARAMPGDRPLLVTVHDDEQVALGDARILWERGGLALDAAARAVAVRAELANLLPVIVD